MKKKKSFNFSLRWHCFGWNRSDEPNVCGETGRNSKGDWSCTLITKINNCMIDGNKGKPRASIVPYPLSSISQVPRWCGRSRCHFSFAALLPRRAASAGSTRKGPGFPVGMWKQYCQEQRVNIRRYQTLPSVCEAAWSWEKCAWCHKK